MLKINYEGKTLELAREYVKNLHAISAENNNISQADKDLFNAVQKNDFNSAQELLNKGAKPTKRGILYWAIKNNNLTLFNLLLDQNANSAPFRLDYEDYDSPLRYAYNKKAWNFIETFAKKRNLSSDENASYVLLASVHDNQFEIVESLLRAGARPIGCYVDSGNSHLHEAVNHNNPQMCALLVLYGTNLDKRNKQGKTALELAANNNQTACCDAMENPRLYYSKIEEKQLISFDLWRGQEQSDSLLSKLPRPILENIIRFAFPSSNNNHVRFLQINEKLANQYLKKVELYCRTYKTYTAGYFEIPRFGIKQSKNSLEFVKNLETMLKDKALPITQKKINIKTLIEDFATQNKQVQEKTGKENRAYTLLKEYKLLPLKTPTVSLEDSKGVTHKSSFLASSNTDQSDSGVTDTDTSTKKIKGFSNN